MGHDEAAQAVVHQPGGHEETVATTETHGPGLRQHVPWIEPHDKGGRWFSELWKLPPG